MSWSRETLREAMVPDKIELEPAFENVATARRFVADRLCDVAADSAIVDDLRLATSELVTNAVEHGNHERVIVELTVNPNVVSLSVTSHSPCDHVAPVCEWIVAEADEITGRGLGIVRTLADDVSVSRGGGMLTITIERRLA